MLGTIISAIIGGGGGWLGSSVVTNLVGNLSTGGSDGIIGIVSGLVGGGAIGKMMGGGSAAASAGAAAAGGSINPKQIIGGLLGGAGAGAIGQGILGAIM